VADNLGSLSNIELNNFIHDLRTQIVALKPHIEGPQIWRRRSIDLLAGGILTGGGFFGANLDPLSLILVPLGFIVWIRAIADDARAMNRHLTLRRQLTMLQSDLAAAEAELDRRFGP
jgi:hypothetical protein